MGSRIGATQANLRSAHVAQAHEQSWRLSPDRLHAAQGGLTRPDAPGKASQPFHEHWMNLPPFSSEPDALLGAGVAPECPP